MVKIQIMSDLHIEGFKDPNVEDYITPVADILILVGDIGRIYKFYQLRKFMIDLCKKFKLVLYTPGNQEYYMCNKSAEDMDVLKKKLESLCNICKNLIILDRKSVITENYCIIGCTLWSDIKVENSPQLQKIHGMTADKYAQMHSKDVEYINKQIKYCKDHNYKLLVVTHHPPSFSVLKRKDSEYASLYASNMDSLLSSIHVNTWIFGHTHNNFDMLTEGGTRLVSNQRGKKHENVMDFSKEKIIELK